MNSENNKNGFTARWQKFSDLRKRGWGHFSQKTPEQLAMLKDHDHLDIAAMEEAAGPLEKSAGQLIREVIKKGKEDPKNYERFTTHVKHCTDEPVLTLVFGSLDEPATIDLPPDARQSLLLRALQLPQGADMYPSQGTRCVFRGPAARASLEGPEQLKRVSDAVYAKAKEYVDQFIELHHGRCEIKVFGFSTGTHDATLVANRLGKELGKPVDKLTLVAPGMSIGRGEFAAWPASPGAEALKEKGYTAESYHQAIYEYTQEANVEHLPTGEHLEIHYGTHDTIIPPYKAGGTLDLLNHLKANGKEPTAIVYHGMDHVTMPGTIIWELARGTSDPYALRSKRTVFEYGLKQAA